MNGHGNTTEQRLRSKMVSAQDGDKKAYTELLQEITRILHGTLRKKILEEAGVEDVVQEILLSIHRARHTYDPSRPFLPWMFAIAKYRLSDYLRKYYRSKARQTIDYTEIEEQLADEGQPVEKISEALDSGLAALPDKQRKIVTMMKVEGYSVREVADHFDMSVSAVKVSAHRAYKRLKKSMEREG